MVRGPGLKVGETRLVDSSTLAPRSESPMKTIHDTRSVEAITMCPGGHSVAMEMKQSWNSSRFRHITQALSRLQTGCTASWRLKREARR